MEYLCYTYSVSYSETTNSFAFSLQMDPIDKSIITIITIENIIIIAKGVMEWTQQVLTTISR